MKIFSPVLKGTTISSGGTTNLSGSFTGSLSGTATTASYVDSSQTDTAQNTRLTTLESVTGSFTLTSSFGAYTASNDSLNTTQNARILSNEQKTGSFATTGSNFFIGNQVITGSVYIANDLVVQGSSSLQNITASAVSVGTNTIILNTATPILQFGGISVQDSGSTMGRSGSLLWNSINDHWINVNPSGSDEGYNSAMVINGPKNTGSLGSEVGLTTNYIPVSQGEDHITDSIIFQSGSNIGVGTTSLSGTYGRLSVAGGISILNDNNAKLEIGRYSSGTPNSYIKIGANSNSLRFTNNNDSADLLYLTNSGNLGIGTTPSSWMTPFTVIQGGSYGQHIGFQSNGPDMKIGSNNYYSGSNYFYTVSANGAAQFNIGGNSGFEFLVAPSGTFNTAVTFTSSLAITNTGNVGIGRTNPFNKVTIRTGTGNNLDIFDTGASFGLGMQAVNDVNTVYKSWDFYASKFTFFNGTVGIGVSPSTAYLDIIGSNSSTNSLQLRSGNLNVGSGSNQIIFGYNGTEGYRHAIKTRHNSSAAAANAIDFYVWKSSTDSVGTIGTQHVMSLDGGSVGIGTTTPSELLDIRGANRDISSAEFNQVIHTTTSQSAGFGGAIGLGGYYTGTTVTAFGGIKGAKENSTDSNTAGYLSLHTRPNAGAITERMRLTSGGNLGLNLTVPTQRLSIRGNQVFTNQDVDGVTNALIAEISSQARGYSNQGANMASIQFRTNPTTWYRGEIAFITNNSDGTNPNSSVLESMRINSAGQVTLPYQPAFYAWTTTGASTRTTGAFTSFNATRVNRGGHYNTSNGRFTAPIAGVYEFVFSLLWRNDVGEAGAGEISIGVNGSNVGARGMAYSSSPSTNNYHAQTVVNLTLNLSAGDYVTGWIHVSGTSVGNWYYGDNLAYFSGKLLG